jgi:hypothetical protein
MQIELKVADVVFREDLYPRIKGNPETIQKYAECIEHLPPIEVNQNNELIDGFHRWKAHVKAEAETMLAIVTQTKSESEFLTLAIERNADHGLQLSNADKRRMALSIYSATVEKERPQKKKDLISILKVSQKTVSNWLRDIDKAAKEDRDRKIFEMWLSCHTQAEIAEVVGLSQNQITDNISVLSKMENLPNPMKHATEYSLEDESLPRFTVWSFGSKTNKVGHFGNSEQTIVDWLLYLYTNPFDIVVDPFAGGGSTIDVCQKRLRRYWAGDRNVIPERQDDIRHHDIIGPDKTVLMPNLKGRWKDVKLVYLDPPYWLQAKGKYGDGKTNLANMDSDEFHDSLVSIINTFLSKSENAHIALLMQPTQWNSPDKSFVDHVLNIAPRIKSSVKTRIQAPYQKASCSPPMYKWGEDNKELLVLSREIIVWGPSNE